MWQEIWFWTPELRSHQTTELHKLQAKELKSMPTNNIICERLLATFSHRADVSKFRKRNLSARGIKDNKSSLSSKSVNYIINNKNCSKITQ